MRISRLSIRIGLAGVSATALVLVLTGAFSAQARTIAKPTAASSHTGFAVKVANTDFGSDGARGHFSAKLSAGARDVAAVLAAVTGVPYPEIARGGTYVAKVTGDGGLAVVRFSDHALGTACVKYSAKAGTYNPSLGYLKVTGSMTIVGGTGQAAHWTGTIKFRQTGLTGKDTLVFGGTAIGSTRAAHGLTAACTSAAKLKG
ncbi:MAG: hypothetical protein JO027_10760 [Solirubrobacterales bacterium]|nr:hypothetical protein [Solirubrobacterales bacterium]